MDGGGKGAAGKSSEGKKAIIMLIYYSHLKIFISFTFKPGGKCKKGQKVCSL